MILLRSTDSTSSLQASSVFARILAAFLLLFSILFMPLWVSVVLALAGMIYYPFFLEAIFLFLLSDVLYGIPEPSFLNMIFISFLTATIVLIIIEFLKKKLKFYPHT